MKVAVVQHDIVWEDKDANFARLAPMVASAAATGARLVVLSETFSTGFSMRTDVIAEPEGGPSSQFLIAQAAAHGVWVCGSCPEVGDGGDRPRNTLVLAGPDGTVAPLPQDPPLRLRRRGRVVRRRVRAGHRRRRGPAGQPVRLLRPALRRRVVGGGAPDRPLPVRGQLARAPPGPLVGAAAGPGDREPGVRGGLQPGRHRRSGSGDTLEYAGDSAIVDPMGEALATGARTEALLVADVTADRVAEVRKALPFLADR